MAIDYLVPENGTGKIGISFRRLTFICLLIGVQFSTAYAASTQQSLTLEKALKRTLAQNPNLKVYEFRHTALTGQMATASLKPAYEIGLEAENFLGSDEFNGLDRSELTLAISSVIQMSDKRGAQQGVVTSSRSMLDVQRQLKSLELMGEATRRYIDVLAAQETVSLAKDAAELASKTLKLVQRRSSAGATSDAEVKRAIAASAQAQLRLQSITQQFEYTRVALAALWGETTPTFASVEGDLFRFGTDIPFDVLYAKVGQNPVIQIFAAEERLKEAELRLAKSQSSSDIGWSLGIRRFQEGRDSAFVAGISVPLFGAKRNSGVVSSKLAQKNEVQVQREIALINMHTQLFQAFSNRKQAIRVSEALQQNIIPALEQALAATELAYERGRYSYVEFISSGQALIDARRTLIESAASALIYAAEIEQLTAEPLSASQYQEATDASGVNP